MELEKTATRILFISLHTYKFWWDGKDAVFRFKRFSIGRRNPYNVIILTNILVDKNYLSHLAYCV